MVRRHIGEWTPALVGKAIHRLKCSGGPRQSDSSVCHVIIEKLNCAYCSLCFAGLVLLVVNDDVLLTGCCCCVHFCKRLEYYVGSQNIMLIHGDRSLSKPPPLQQLSHLKPCHSSGCVSSPSESGGTLCKSAGSFATVGSACPWASIELLMDFTGDGGQSAITEASWQVG